MDGQVQQNSDGSAKVYGKLPLAGNDTNTLSAVGGLENSKNGIFKSATGGLAFDNANRVGASIGLQHMDLLKKTDYSAMGNLNVFRTPTSSLDISAGGSKTVSPFMPKSGWQPSGAMSFNKRF